MFRTLCPSCGAQVEFRSAASVMAVCPYCRSTLLRDADALRDIGKMSAVLEDYSPIQIGTTGMLDAEGAAIASKDQPATATSLAAKRFTVVGRIQLQYEDGMWNEWYLHYDDGTSGWLSDASGQYTLTFSLGKDDQAPRFAQIRIGQQHPYRNKTFFVSDIRTAHCVAGEGELPFKVGAGWIANVVDCRSDDQFITLDYSDGDDPEVFHGLVVPLEKLGCQLLRADDQIIASAGRLRGATASFACPSCGAPVNYRAGVAENIICPSCQSAVALKQGQAEVLAKHERITRIDTSLRLGDKGHFDGAFWELIGLMQCCEMDNGSSPWTEYLLYSPRKGFKWLVESEDGWDLVEVLDEWPSPAGNDYLFRGKTYRPLYAYQAKVLYAIGAFNWRVELGDRRQIDDYGKDEAKLTAETTPDERTWSLSRRVPAAMVAKWFRKPEDTLNALNSNLDSGVKKLAWLFTVILLTLNLPMLFFEPVYVMFVVAFGVLFLWLPFLKMGDGDDDD